jgi:serine/threonine-protein kinase HipA
MITRLAGDTQVFAFDEDYINDPERPTLSLSFKSRTGGLITSVQKARRRVPVFFSNVLPEGHLRDYLAAQAGVSPEREFFLLAALGGDLAGAVTVTPEGESAKPHQDAGGEDGPAAAPDEPGPLRFSLAGVQLKFSALMESAGGLTIPACGVGGDWIVKLPSIRFPAVAENEFVMLELARAVGIEVPRTRLVPVSEVGGLPAEAARLAGNALAVERFDRAPDGRRIHMEDFAQVFGRWPEEKYKGVSYANIARVLWAETGEAGAYEFVRRLVFSVLIGNADMHLKNFSMLFPDGRTPALSPAYDFVSTLPYLPEDKLALTFGGSRDMTGITPDQLRRFTDRAGLPYVPTARIVKETAQATLEAWGKLAAKEILPVEIFCAVDDQVGQAAGKVIRESVEQ